MLRSVDWLTIKQEYPEGGLPVVGDGYVWAADADGCPEWSVVRAFSHEGSHDTRVRVRCDGRTVEWSGNPSRWGRVENVFGYATVRAALDAVVNVHLRALGLPPFTKETRFVMRHGETRATPYSSLRFIARDDLDVPDGAVITRVDLAAMYAAGSPRDRDAVIRSLGQIVQHGRPAMTYPGTAAWGSKRMASHVAYDKAREMRAHKSKSKDAKALQYRERLIEWLEKAGAIRLETKLGRDWLRKNGRRRLCDYDDEAANQAVQTMIEKAMPSVNNGGLSDIAERLEADGLSSAVAQKCQGLAYEWAAGVDVFGRMNKNTGYKYRRHLRAVGIDIREPLRDVTTLRVQPRVIDLQPLAAPDWYQHAA